MPNALSKCREAQHRSGDGKNGKREVFDDVFDSAVKRLIPEIFEERVGQIIHPDIANPSYSPDGG
jgi:hypothetical protein